jgi:hypothetical protein
MQQVIVKVYRRTGIERTTVVVTHTEHIRVFKYRPCCAIVCHVHAVFLPLSFLLKVVTYQITLSISIYNIGFLITVKLELQLVLNVELTMNM